jgi:hypothetical protein
LRFECGGHAVILRTMITPYETPFTLTPRVLALVAEIGEALLNQTFSGEL